MNLFRPIAPQFLVMAVIAALCLPGCGNDGSPAQPQPGAAVQLTHNSGEASSPCWSPDGGSLAFAASPPGGWPEIWIVPASGGSPRRLTTAGGERPTWSPDGEWIAFDNPLTDCLCIERIPAAGGSVLPVVTGGLEPAWSPDGSWIVYADRSQPPSWNLAVVPATGGENVAIPNGEKCDSPTHPAWSPNGDRIAFSAHVPCRTSHIFLAPWPPDGAPVQITSGTCVDLHPAWSPDGRWIAFDSNRSGRAEIWIVSVGGGTPVQVTTEGGANPCWRPDGRTIAFTSDRGGNPEVWLLEID